MWLQEGTWWGGSAECVWVRVREGVSRTYGPLQYIFCGFQSLPAPPGWWNFLAKLSVIRYQTKGASTHLTPGKAHRSTGGS